MSPERKKQTQEAQQRARAYVQTEIAKSASKQEGEGQALGERQTTADEPRKQRRGLSQGG